MKHALLFVIAAGLVLGGCGKKSEPAKPASEPAKSEVGENPLNAPAEYVGAAVKAQQHAVKTLGKTSLDQAIKNFAAQEGRNPKDLQELVTSGVLPRLPAPPAGMRFSYDAASGEVKVVPSN